MLFPYKKVKIKDSMKIQYITTWKTLKTIPAT